MEEKDNMLERWKKEMLGSFVKNTYILFLTEKTEMTISYWPFDFSKSRKSDFRDLLCLP